MNNSDRVISLRRVASVMTERLSYNEEYILNLFGINLKQTIVAIITHAAFLLRS